MAEQKVIDLVPWVHGASALGQEELLGYIHTLPRNSVLFLEGTARVFLYAESEMDLLVAAREKADFLKVPQPILAAGEILH
ncbi:MAG: hypothetical protein WCW13_02270 [archaeon]